MGPKSAVVSTDGPAINGNGVVADKKWVKIPVKYWLNFENEESSLSNIMVLIKFPLYREHSDKEVELHTNTDLLTYISFERNEPRSEL